MTGMTPEERDRLVTIEQQLRQMEEDRRSDRTEIKGLIAAYNMGYGIARFMLLISGAIGLITGVVTAAISYFSGGGHK